jgi:hypothetical protein
LNLELDHILTQEGLAAFFLIERTPTGANVSVKLVLPRASFREQLTAAPLIVLNALDFVAKFLAAEIELFEPRGEPTDLIG